MRQVLLPEEKLPQFAIKPIKNRYTDYLATVKEKGADHELGGTQGVQVLKHLELMKEQPGHLKDEAMAEIEALRLHLLTLDPEQHRTAAHLFRQREFYVKVAPEQNFY